MGHRNKAEAEKLNRIAFQHYYNRLNELAISMFEWKNVPESIDVRFLEMTLFNDGMAIFFYDEALQKYLALQVMLSGDLNVYRIPKIRTAYAVTGYNYKLNEKNSVIIFNNMVHTNLVNDTEYFALKLSECDRSVMTNVKAQKTPILISCDENQRLTMLNLYNQYNGNQPFIFGSKDIDFKKIQAISTGAPYVADKLTETKNQIWNEALTCLGISNVSFNKKERLISDEISRGMGATVASRYTRLFMRQQACEQINRMFGLNMSVKYKDEYNVYDDTESDEEIMNE